MSAWSCWALVLVGVLVVHRLKDQRAPAVTRSRPDVLVGVLGLVRRDLHGDGLAVQVSALPLGMIGVISALFLTNTTLNVTSFMGIIMMVGIVISTLYVMLGERFPRRVEGLEGETALQGDPA